MSNTSATGGYLLPTNEALPGGLSLEDFLHGVIVGLTAYDKKLVRPRFQVEPGKQPPQPTDNWISFSIIEDTSDANAFTSGGENESKLQRHVELQLFCSFYGSNGFANAGAFRDGFQITQNREELFKAKMGFKESSRISFVPELINNRWFDRSDVTITLRREINRTYEILSLQSAGGEILIDNDSINGLTSSWNVEE